MSGLSIKELMKTLKQFNNQYPTPAPNLFDSLFYKPTFAGMNLYEAPSPQPKIQVEDIKFDDGTSILSEEFRSKMNTYLIKTFGHHDDIFKNTVYTFGNRCIMSKENMNTIINSTIT